MTSWLAGLWLTFSQLMTITVSPLPSTSWQVTKNWEKSGSHGVIFEAQSQVVPEMCQKNPEQSLQLPQIIHGVHQIFSKDRLLFQSGDPTFRKVSYFYEHPIVPCSVLLDATEIRWVIHSSTHYFARLRELPVPSDEYRWAPMMDITLNSLMVGVMFFLSSVAYMLFWRRVDRWMIRSMVLSSIFGGLYTMNCVAPSFGLPLSMLSSHKFADVSLSLATVFFFLFQAQMGYLRRWQFVFVSLGTFLTVTIVILARSSDEVQMGTNIGVVFGFLGFTMLFGKILSHVISPSAENHSNLKTISKLGLISVVAQMSAGMLDISHIVGLIDSYMIMPVGFSISFVLLLLIANSQIEATYKERDSLLETLEQKVEEKTFELSNAVKELQHSQAELVQSSKLASLGTLSAGIAHEINNSINFVNGAVIPLERKVMPLIPSEDQASIQKLFAAIKHGTDMTVQIVRSLRSFTGLNQAEFKDVAMKEVVQSVLTILRSKLSSVDVQVHVGSDIFIEGSQVGLSQILMNLVSNAVDVLPSQGVIQVTAEKQVLQNQEWVEIRVQDNGSGIPAHVVDRIFDPFFTTKGVGKGTGLGLFIVRKEVDRHHGQIHVASELGKGTCFTIRLPRHAELNSMELKKGAA